MKSLRKILIAVVLFISMNATGQVKYDEGAVYAGGLTFLQSSNDSLDYYYLPQFPRLSTRADGSFEFLCLKYTSSKAENSGGLLHALVDFSVPDSLMDLCVKKLREVVPGAKLRGAVPIMETKNEGDENVRPSFEIVSAILSNKGGKDAMTQSVVTSGYAPFTPGSKAAVAALLNTSGSTLLWNSFTGPTGDVSIAVNGYYEAKVRSFNAVVTAEMSVIYNHLSEMSANQKGFTKNQIRKVVDELKKTGSIKVDVFDRSAGLGIKPGDQNGILNTITTKLTEVMFDAQSGWSKEPERVDPNLGFDPRSRQGDKTPAGQVIGEIGDAMTDVLGALPVLGWFSSKKKKNTNPEYVTDDQYVLKDIKNIRTSKFYLNLSQSTTIKVPFHTAGNLGGLYAKLGEDKRYFRIVNMDDDADQRRSINFQVDGDFVEAFDDIINFVTVNFRKKYSNGQSDVTSQLIINGSDLKKGINLKELSYPRLGIKTADWLNYEYQLFWSFKGRNLPIRFPADEKQWIKSSDPAISLIPPLVKEYVEVDADRKDFLNNNIATANVSFASIQGGEKKVIRSIILRSTDNVSTNKVALYHDAGAPVVFQPTWHSTKGEAKLDLKVMSSGYVFLTPPAPEKFVSQ